MEKVLKITEDIRSELTEKGIVICTFEKDDVEFDGIDYSHQAEYPSLEVVEIEN